MQQPFNLPPVNMNRIPSEFHIEDIHVEVLIDQHKPFYFSVCITDARTPDVLEGFYTWEEYEKIISFLKNNPHRYKVAEAKEKYPPLDPRTVRIMKNVSPRW